MNVKTFGLGEDRSGKDLFAFKEILDYWELKFGPYYRKKYTAIKNLKGKGGVFVLCDRKYRLIKVQYSEDDIYNYVMQFLGRNEVLNKQSLLCCYIKTNFTNANSVIKSICKTYHYKPISQIIFKLEKSEFTNFSIFLDDKLWENASSKNLISFRYRAGVYIIREKISKEITYVGKSHSSAYYRMKKHFYRINNTPHHVFYPNPEMMEVCFVEIPRAKKVGKKYVQNGIFEIKDKCHLVESCLIKKFQPRDNKYLLGESIETIDIYPAPDESWDDGNLLDEAPF